MTGKLEGLDICPESAVGIAGLRNLVDAGAIDYDEEVVLLNTGGGTRYTNITNLNIHGRTTGRTYYRQFRALSWSQRLSDGK